MKYVIGSKNDFNNYDTYEKAEEQAKRYVSNRNGNGQPVYVFSAVAEVKSPVPEAIVTKL